MKPKRRTYEGYWSHESEAPHLFTEADRIRDGRRYVCLKVIELMDSFDDNRPGVAETKELFREIAEIEMGE